MRRISIINVNLSSRDAIGNCVLQQARFFQRRGDEVKIYLQDIAQDVPASTRSLCNVVSLADLMSRRDEHFAMSDLYIYHYPMRYSLIESIFGIERGAVIFYFHNVTPPELWDSDFERDNLHHSLQSVGLLARYADLIVTDSPFNGEDLVKKHGCEPDRVRVLPLAVSLADFTPGPRNHELVKKYNLDGKKVLLFVGRMAGNKRVDLLIDSVAILKQRHPNIVLMLAGDNHSNPGIQAHVAKVKQRVKQLDVAEQVIWTGSVDETAPYYRSADVYVSASLHEGFGVPLIEAMASGVPVVVSRATGHPWVVGDAGLLCNPGQPEDMAAQVDRVLSDDSLRGELVQRGLERVGEFSLERYEDGWSRIVAEATAWLPNQAYPRFKSRPAQNSNSPITSPNSDVVTKLEFVKMTNEVQHLWNISDIVLRNFVIRSQLPFIGGFIAWVRKNLTFHVREMYLDPTLEKQVAYNRHVAFTFQKFMEFIMEDRVSTTAIIGHLQKRFDELESGKQTTQDTYSNVSQEHLVRVEAWLKLLSAQVAFLQVSQGQINQTESISELRAQLEQLRQQLGERPK